MMLVELVVSMGSGFAMSDARELTSQWDFVTRSIARLILLSSVFMRIIRVGLGVRS